MPGAPDLGAARAGARLAAFAALLRGEPVPWSEVGGDGDQVLAALADEDLIPLVHQSLRRLGGGVDWPEEVRRKVQERAAAAAATELLARRELLRVLDALARHGVEPLLLKGTALAYGLYPEPSLRPRADTDWLIRDEDRDAVRAVMGELGYTPALLCDGELVFRQFELERRDDWDLTHAMDFHWRISTQVVFADLFAYGELRQRAQRIPALGPQARGCGVLDALLLALIHPVMHHRAEVRLIWMYDVHLLAQRLDGSGWSAFVELACRKRVARVAAWGLEGARRYLRTPVPAPVLERLREVSSRHEPSARYLTPRGGWVAEAVANVRQLESWRDRLRLLREIAFPSGGYLLRAYGLDHSPMAKLLLPVLYVHRGVRGVVRVLRGRK